jgi:hypothetical protein
MHALAAGTHIRFDRRRAALSRVIDRGADHRYRQTFAAVAAAHRDARDHPGGDVVDGRSCPRVLDDRVVVPRTQGDEPDGLRAPVRHQAG